MKGVEKYVFNGKNRYRASKKLVGPVRNTEQEAYEDYMRLFIKEEVKEEFKESTTVDRDFRFGV